MPQPFKAAVITNDGAQLLTRAQAGEISIEFTRIAIGNGVYTEEQKGLKSLQKSKELKGQKNSYPLSSVEIYNEHSVKVTALITNQNIDNSESLVNVGYYINEMGLYAKPLGGTADTEVLYSIAVTCGNMGDFMPPYNGYHSAQIIQEYYVTVSNSAEVSIKATGAALLVEVAEKEYLKKTSIVNGLEEAIVETAQQRPIGCGVASELNSNIERMSEELADISDSVYQQSTGYTDTKIAELINGAPSTLDTLGEIAQAMQNNEDVVEALESAIGNKAQQAELDGHTGNGTIHITASERTGWNNKMEKTGDISNTTAAFTQASKLENIRTGEKISAIMGKVSKAIATLISHVEEKATSSKFGHVKLSDTYKSAVSNGAAANGVGASQKAIADAYSDLSEKLGGCWISFTDADGNPTDQPYIHWYADDGTEVTN